MSRARALWLPYRVADLDTARDFYTVHLGLSEVDGWDRSGERGVVLRAAGDAFVELVSTGPAGPPGPAGSAGAAPLAFELADAAAVDRVHRRFRPADPPRRHPRGHYGFEVPAPGGATVMIWSER